MKETSKPGGSWLTLTNLQNEEHELLVSTKILNTYDRSASMKLGESPRMVKPKRANDQDSFSDDD